MLRAKLDVVPTQAPRGPVAQRDSSGQKDAVESFSRLVDRKEAATPVVAKDEPDTPAPLAAKPDDIGQADIPAGAMLPDTAQASGWQAILAQLLSQAETQHTSPQSTPERDKPAAAEVAKAIAPEGKPVTPTLPKAAPVAHGDSIAEGWQAAAGAPDGDRLQQQPLAEGSSKQGAATHQPGGEPPAARTDKMGNNAGDDEVRPVVVSHVSSTTHYPVVADPIRQIVSEVSREVTATRASSAAQPADAAPGQQSTKTLHVQLEPESLGAVTVRMRLSGARLSVQLDVARPETLAMITRQQDVLHRSLGSDHCHVDSLTIRAAVTPDAPVASQSAQGGTSQDSGRNGASQQGDATAFAGGRSNGQRDRQETPKRLQNDEIPGASDRAAVARGLYL